MSRKRRREHTPSLPARLPRVRFSFESVWLRWQPLSIAALLVSAGTVYYTSQQVAEQRRATNAIIEVNRALITLDDARLVDGLRTEPLKVELTLKNVGLTVALDVKADYCLVVARFGTAVADCPIGKPTMSVSLNDLAPGATIPIYVTRTTSWSPEVQVMLDTHKAGMFVKGRVFYEDVLKRGLHATSFCRYFGDGELTDLPCRETATDSRNLPEGPGLEGKR